MNKPLVSVIIPTFNRANYLDIMINSIIKMKGVDIELIIVDDNSKDETKEIINKYNGQTNLIYIKNNINKGPGISRNIGYKAAKGNFIVFADDDDFYTSSNFFNEAIEILTKNSNLAFVSGKTNILINDKIEENPNDLQGFISNEKYLQGFMTKYKKPSSTFTTVFNRVALEKAELSKMKMVNDASIYMRALVWGGAYIINSIIGTYRIHDNNITKYLSSNFIIENLEEKKIIRDMAKLNYIFLDINWLKIQYFLTIDYYFKNNKYKINDVHKIYLWGIKNKLIGWDNYLKAIFKYYLSKK